MRESGENLFPFSLMLHEDIFFPYIFLSLADVVFVMHSNISLKKGEAEIIYSSNTIIAPLNIHF